MPTSRRSSSVIQMDARRAGISNGGLITNSRPGVIGTPKYEDAINKSSVAACLLTENFFGSNFNKDKELPYLLNRAKKRLVVIPVIVRPAAFKSIPLARYRKVSEISLARRAMRLDFGFGRFDVFKWRSVSGIDPSVACQGVNHAVSHVNCSEGTCSEGTARSGLSGP